MSKKRESKKKKEGAEEIKLQAQIVHRGSKWFYCPTKHQCRPNARCLICKADCFIREDMQNMWTALGFDKYKPSTYTKDVEKGGE